MSFPVPLSVLDLAPITEGGSAAQSFANTVDLAQHAERWGFRRYWLAEHHSMPGIASAATSVLIGQVAAATSRLRVGAGGIMLPNHSPLVIAEQFGTLAALFPGRIELGLGRAPGSDPVTARALRRASTADAEAFPDDVAELLAYFAGCGPVRAVPGNGAKVPVWILGSSLFGARLAATLGLPYSFASHFAPAQMRQAVALYRSSFRPSEYLAEPWVMLGYNVFAADTDDEANYLASSWQHTFVDLRLGHPGRLPRPTERYLESLPVAVRALIDRSLACSAIGTAEKVAHELAEFAKYNYADELIITSGIHDHAARLHSYELVAQVMNSDA